MKWLIWFTPIWKLLLLLYPPPFRARFGAEMLQVLTTACSQQLQQRGSAHATFTCLRSCAELGWRGLWERWEAIPMISWLVGLLALACALFAGYVDFHNNEVQAAALVLIVSSFVLALAQPRYALLWTPLLGLGIPLAHYFGVRLGYQPTDPRGPSGPAVAIFLLPAFIAFLGAAGGVVTRKVVKLY